GRIVDCATHDKLAPVLSELLSDPIELDRMGKSARSWAVEQFDWKSLTRQAMQLFNRQPKSRTLSNDQQPPQHRGNEITGRFVDMNSRAVQCRVASTSPTIGCGLSEDLMPMKKQTI